MASIYHAVVTQVLNSTPDPSFTSLFLAVDGENADGKAADSRTEELFPGDRSQQTHGRP